MAILRNLWQQVWGSVRGRLMILNLGCLIIILLLLIVLQYLALQQFLIDQTSTMLQVEAKSSITRWMRSSVGRQKDVPRLGALIVTDLTGPESRVQVFDTNRALVSSSETLASYNADIPLPTVNAGAVQQTLDGEDLVTYLYGQGKSRMVIDLVPLRAEPEASSGEIIGVVQVSTSFRRQDATLQELLLIDVVGLAGVLLVIGFLAFPIVRTTLSPLRGMAHTAEAIGRGDFSQRLHLPQGKDEIGHLAATFDDMAEQLEKLFLSQHQFIGDASHELRTPLTALRGSIEVLQRDPYSNPEITKRMLNGMYREITRLSRLVTDLLTLSQFDLGVPVRPQPFELSRLVADVYDQAQILAKGQQLNLHIEPDSPVYVCGDVDRLREVLLNLVDNAISHTPADGEIDLGLKRDGGNARIWVKDSGEGIPAEALPHLFERFYRADKSRARQRGGAGLGLSITKAIVDAHGGTVHAESTYGSGSCFTVTLPLTQKPDTLT